MKKILFLFLFFPLVSFASFPIKNDTIKKETVEQYYKRINKQMEVNDNKWEIEEVKPFIDVERVPKLLWFSFLIPIINFVAFLYILFKYGNNFAKALGTLLIISSILIFIGIILIMEPWSEDFNIIIL